MNRSGIEIGLLFSSLAAAGLIAATPAASRAFYQADSTKRMAARLEQAAQAVDPMEVRFLSLERAQMIQSRLTFVTSPRARFELERMLAMELLNAGRTAEALSAFKRVEQRLRREGIYEANRTLLRTYQAVCHLRRGEQENCLANHTVDSCLLPIRGAGVHRLQSGSRAALGVLTNYLAETPGDLGARWLLNIAYMTVGEYPERVPAPWLIPPETFASEYDIKRFQDVAGKVGLGLQELSGGSVLEDFDGDGYLDLMVSSIGFRDPLRFFRNNADGGFTERTHEAGLTGETGGLNLVQADYNNDGHPDVLVLRGAWFGTGGRIPNSLLRNNGDGTFDDVTEAAGLLSPHPTQTAVWFDYNSDGWLDVFIGNESSSGYTNRCELYRNNRDCTFTERAAETGADYIGFVKGVAAGDFNNDGRPDLYLSVLGSANVLFRNDGPRDGGTNPAAPWRFTNVAAAAGVEEPLYSFPTWFFDYDNDGWPDLFVAGYRIKDVGEIAADYLGLPHTAERARLFRNQGDGTFSNVTAAVRLDKVLHAMGCNYGDLDNDGYLDFYVGTGDPDLSTLVPNRMFRNAGGKWFQEVTTSGGFGHLQKGHGVSFGDIDQDGDQDIFQDMGGAYTGDVAFNVLYENPGHGNRWIGLKLEGTQSNRLALGAQIKLITRHAGGTRTIYRTVSSGGSFGASPLRQQIGLGQAEAIESIEILWPATHQTQRFDRGLALDQWWRIREGDAEPEKIVLKSFKLGAEQQQHHPGQ